MLVPTVYAFSPQCFFVGAAHHALLGESDFDKHYVVRPALLNGKPWHGARGDCKEWLALEAAAHRGEEAAVSAYAKAGEALGFGLARIIAILTPSRIVLAGPGTRAMALIAPHLNRALEAGVVDELRRNVAIEVVPIDTDMIIPKQFLKTIKRTGLGKSLFFEMRFTQDGVEVPDFVLNRPAYRKAEILVAGDNFGCGSSREHAPWALLDFGIRCVISTSFADIFYNNCFKNGILPIKVSPEDLKKLMDDAERGANATMTIDLPSQEIRGPDGGTIKFDLDPFRKHCLLNGLDDIGLSLEKASSIDSFEKKQATSQPWL